LSDAAHGKLLNNHAGLSTTIHYTDSL